MTSRPLLIAAAALALVAAGVGLLVARFDPAAATDEVRQYFRERYGRDLSIEGPLSLSFWPGLSISVPGARLSEPGSERVAASFDSARAELAWLPLARGRVIVERLSISGLHARIERRADGSRNIDNLVDPIAPTADAAPGDEDLGRPRRVEIGRIELTDASLEYEDLRDGNRLWLDGIDLTLDDLAARVVTPMTLRARLIAAPSGPSGLLRVAGSLELDFSRKTVGLRGMEASLKGFMSGQNLDLNARARRAALRLTDGGRTWRFESFALTAKGSREHWSVETGHVKAGVLELDPSNLAMTANALEVTLKGKHTGEAFEASLSVPEAVIATSGTRGKPIEATVRRRGERESDLRLVIEGLSGSARDLSAQRVSLSLEHAISKLDLSLKLAGALRADIEAATFELSQASGTLTLDPAGGRTPLRMALAGDLHGDALHRTFKFQTETRIETSLIKLQAAVDAQPSPPELRLDIQADQIDGERLDTSLGPLVEAARVRKTPSPASNTGRNPLAAAPPPPLGRGASANPSAAPSEALLQILSIANWQASIEVGRLKAGSLHTAGLRVAARGRDGEIRIDSLSGSLHGGTVQAKGQINALNGLFSLTLQASDIVAGDLLWQSFGSRIIEGQGMLRADLKGSARPAESLLSSIRGQVTLKLGEGRLNGIDLNQSARSAGRPARPATGSADEPRGTPLTDLTEFTRMSASFSLRDGVARSRDLLLETPLLRLSGAGSIDLSESLVDASLRLGLRPGSVRDRLTAALARVSIPLQLNGPVRSPTWSIDLPALPDQRPRQ